MIPYNNIIQTEEKPSTFGSKTLACHFGAKGIEIIV